MREFLDSLGSIADSMLARLLALGGWPEGPLDGDGAKSSGAAKSSVGGGTVAQVGCKTMYGNRVPRIDFKSQASGKDRRSGRWCRPRDESFVSWLVPQWQ
jgi:hypothetical protein